MPQYAGLGIDIWHGTGAPACSSKRFGSLHPSGRTANCDRRPSTPDRRFRRRLRQAVQGSGSTERATRTASAREGAGALITTSPHRPTRWHRLALAVRGLGAVPPRAHHGRQPARPAPPSQCRRGHLREVVPAQGDPSAGRCPEAHLELKLTARGAVIWWPKLRTRNWPRTAHPVAQLAVSFLLNSATC